MQVLYRQGDQGAEFVIVESGLLRITMDRGELAAFPASCGLRHVPADRSPRVAGWLAPVERHTSKELPLPGSPSLPLPGGPRAPRKAARRGPCGRAFGWWQSVAPRREPAVLCAGSPGKQLHRLASINADAMVHSMVANGPAASAGSHCK